ncbi:MAG: hypothetical protein IJP17_05210 [Clostridia bacterium]|nr:hypothetical protein [Clostridia bacterium]
MKKDNYRDYVTDAFRYYALCGRPDSDQLRRLRTVAPQNMRGALSDLEAVSRVINRLNTEPDGEDELHCLELVYFAQPQYYPSRGAITERVRATADKLCMSEASVYRHLRRLRLLMALERGLRIDDRELVAMIK